MKTFEDILAVLHAQGSKSITLEALEEHCVMIKDWVDPDAPDGGGFPCVAMKNGVRWFYDKDRRPKSPSGSPKKALAPTGERPLLGEVDAHDELTLVEGERDFLTAVSIGLNTAVCVGGVQNLTPLQLQGLYRKKAINLVLDNDAKGREAARKLASKLALEGPKVRDVTIPILDADLSDWIESLVVSDEADKLALLLILIRETKRLTKADAKKVDKEVKAEEIIPEKIDELATANGLVTLMFELDDPTQLGVPGAMLDGRVRFAYYDMKKSKESGILSVQYLDSWDPKPDQPQDVQYEHYDGSGDDGDDYDGMKSPNFKSKDGVVRLPMSGETFNRRICLLPSGAREHGTSAALFNELIEFFDKYFVPDDPRFLHAAAAYVLLTYRYRDANYETVPYLHIQGKGGGGKTRFLRLMAELCNRSMFVTSIRSAHLYRILKEFRAGVTLVCEEFNLNDKGQDSADFVNLLNAGNQRGAFVPRMGGQNFSEIEWMECFSPKVLSTMESFTNEGLMRRCVTGLVGTAIVPEEKRIEQLPPEFFTAADAFRQRLLGWRFSKYGEPALKVPNEWREGVKPGVWQNYYPVVSLVPESAVESRDAILSMARDTTDVLEDAHQSSEPAQVLAAALKSTNGRVDRAWVDLMLQNLNDSDRNARWEKLNLLRVLRDLGFKKIPRSKRCDDQTGQHMNDHFIPLDDTFKAIVKQHRFELEIIAGKPAVDDIM